MPSSSRLCLAAAVAGAIFAAPAAQASFMGLHVQIDPYALDGVTTLASLGYGDVAVFNVYAVFDHGLDQCVGVFGSGDSAFTVYSCNEAGFINSPLGGDRPPTAAAAAAFPALNVDSFFTIGNRLMDVGPAWPSGEPFSDQVLIAPGTPGPNTDPWGGGNTNMAWTARPTLPDPGDGREVSTPQTLASNWPLQSVLIMRLAVPHGTDVFGTFGLAFRQFGQPAAALHVTFFASSGGGFGACCLGFDRCIGCTTPVTCTALGGEFMGFGAACPTQQVSESIPENGTIFTHVITVPADCDDDGGLANVCDEGPLLDPWISPPSAQMCHQFGVPGSPAIPAGFFAPGSNPYVGQVCLMGDPLGPLFFPGYGVVDFGPVDTLVQRTADPFDACAIPAAYPTAPASVGLKVAALSMESVQPIVVTFAGGNPQLWNVRVTLSAVYDDGDPGNDPPLGTLTAVKSHPNGGYYTSTLFVQPRFVFRKANDPTQIRILDSGLEDLDPVMLENTQWTQTWVHQVNSAFASPSPFCTDFHPGISGIDPSVVDCNDNQVRDDCEIEDGTAQDCDGNGVPDDCQPTPPCACPADLDGDGEVAVGDLVIVITSWGTCAGACPADLDDDGEVAVGDLVEIITSWGKCG